MKVVLILASSADPDEMQQDAAFHLGLHCLPKYQLRSFQYQGSYRYGKTEFQNFSRTISGLFSFFKDSIFSQFLNKTMQKNAPFFNRKRRSENIEKRRTRFL